MVAEQKAVQHQEPERRRSNQERSQPGGNNPLGIGECEIASHQEQNADDRHVKEFARRVADAASGECAPGEHDQAGNGEAGGAHQAGWNLLNRNADAEIGRAPEDIDQPEGKNDLPALGRFGHVLRIAG